MDLRRRRHHTAADGVEVGQFRCARLLPQGVRGAAMTESETRRLLVDLAASLFARGFSVGSAGNISVRLPDGYLITPTNSSLGRLDAARISRLDADFKHVGGDRPSKEVFMHRAFYTAREDAGAV